MILIACLLLTIALLVLAGVALFRLTGWRGPLIAVSLLVAGAGTAVWRYAQRPDPPEQPCELPAAGELGAVCGFRNPEDVEYVGSLHLLLVSEEGRGGRVLALHPDALREGPTVLWPSAAASAAAASSSERECAPPADPCEMAPHGLSVLEDARDGRPPRVALVSHQLRDGIVTDALQLFDLVGGEATVLRWTGCIPFPDTAIGNDVAWLPDGSLVATNYAPRGTPEELGRAILRGSLGFDTGDVLHWSADRGWTHVPGTQGAIPNGIAAARDGRTFYFADAGHRRVDIVPLPDSAAGDSASGAVARHIAYVSVGGAPDNLSVAPSGAVLATVATFTGDIPFLCSLNGRSCRSGWAVWQIDPNTLTGTEILADDGRRIATATSALEVGGALYLGSMADDRVGVYRKRVDAAFRSEP